ncbi:MAG: hypothetical protein IPI67_39075 [Myxococcales bacterium]|nr:hypothetical protein [Myxococcales bacterium]
MNTQTLRRPKTLLMLGAVFLAICGAAMGRPRSTGPELAAATSPVALAPFEVAQLLSVGPPEVVVVTLDDGRHPLIGAVPITLFGESEDQQIQGAPRSRRIVLVGADAVRTDRVARRLAVTGRDVNVLAGGREAWDRAMDSDPPAPPGSAGAALRAQHLQNIALRRYFGDESGTPKPVNVAPVAAPRLAPLAAKKKREGC